MNQTIEMIDNIHSLRWMTLLKVKWQKNCPWVRALNDYNLPLRSSRYTTKNYVIYNHHVCNWDVTTNHMQLCRVLYAIAMELATNPRLLLCSIHYLKLMLHLSVCSAIFNIYFKWIAGNGVLYVWIVHQQLDIWG
jgi:hypothetical protein